jgi:hypothetical protein
MRVSGSAADTELGRALYDAAVRATLAPSILNSQPWRWRVHRSSLDLSADPDRQIASIDPHRRLMILSCGGALHHAYVALRARGCEPDVSRTPDPAHPDLLARIRVSGPHDVRPADLAEAGGISQRRSDRRVIAATAPVPARDIDLFRRAAADHGVQLHLVTADQRPFLALAAAKAQSTQDSDERYQRDLVAWTDDRPRGAGVPVETLVANVPRPVPLRDFAGGGETALHPGLGDDTFADFLILATSKDEPVDWLRGGEAMSAVWLAATVNSVAASVLSNVIEVPGARALIASLLPHHGHPQLVLRIGVAAQPTPPPASPRRLAETMIDVDDRD